jgi:hypothetical protein
MGINPKGCFLGGMGGKSLIVFQSKKVGFLKNSKELFFWWCGMGCLEKANGGESTLRVNHFCSKKVMYNNYYSMQ